jgi:hypothetical protein
MLIGIDFDDVIFPYHRYLKRRIKLAYGLDLEEVRVTTFFYDHHPELAARGATRADVWRLVQETWLDEQGHEEAEPLHASIPEAIRRMRRRHHVVLVSARADESRPHVEAFLARVGIEVDEVRLGHFDKTGFDVLIDDFPKHAVENAREGGWSVLFTIDENSTFDESKIPHVVRADSWDEVVEAVAMIEELSDHA